MNRIRKLLVANRGEIARRVFQTCRRMGIDTVAVCSQTDRGAPFTREADEVVCLGGASPAESYLRIDAVVQAALKTGADAVHPGYGFLSENAEFVRSCERAGLLFVGPPADAVAAMGSKLGAKEIMRASGVPVLDSRDVSSIDDERLLIAAAEAVGWPVLVKAAFGGGGRGMRVVRAASELAGAVAGARREAASAFGDDTVFFERYIDAPRHVEVQIFGDRHGNVVSLFERECSIQRRHQKVVEESPSVAVDARLRAEMGSAAVAAGKAIGYVGAGTVEFLLTADGEFFFLEVNTRLQVEHPVTECVTGLDLVRLQLLVAQGEALPDEATAASIEGHAIEARLYAEDPEHGYVPTAGTLHRFSAHLGSGLRMDSGVEDGSIVSVNYDPMLAKVICHAPTREEAAQRLATCLRSMQIHGVTTNRDFLVGVLTHPEFLAGTIDTHFLERHDPVQLAVASRRPDLDIVHAAAAALALAALRVSTATALREVPSGWRNNRSQLHESEFELTSGQRLRVGYWLGREPIVEVDGQRLDLELISSCPDWLDLTVGGVQRRFDVHAVADMVYVDSPLGASALHLVDRLPPPGEQTTPGSLVAPMPGTVVRVVADVGKRVVEGETLLFIEAMKMEHPVASPASGTISEVRVGVGDLVDTGQVLAVVETEGHGEIV